MDLLAFERKLDQTIMRKRVDIQEALKRPMKVCARLRLGCPFQVTFLIQGKDLHRWAFKTGSSSAVGFGSHRAQHSIPCRGAGDCGIVCVAALGG